MHEFDTLDTEIKYHLRTHLLHYLVYAHQKGKLTQLEPYQLLNNYIEDIEKPDTIRELFLCPDFTLIVESYNLIRNEISNVQRYAKLIEHPKIERKIKRPTVKQIGYLLILSQKHNLTLNVESLSLLECKDWIQKLK